ncbi:MAG: ATP-grasp domain-containing protein [bacterium]|nr:ATP-grasp domain-containing protein [bacterium]
MGNPKAHTILFLTSAFKGERMIQAVKLAGMNVILITDEENRHQPWPHHSIDEYFVLHDLRRYQDVIHSVSYLSRGRKIDYIIPLDEFEVELAAVLREHLRLDGMTISQVRPFRDKLAMRQVTRHAGIAVPNFIGVLNYDDLRDFMEKTPAPWVLKPRMEAGSMGIRKMHDAEQVWRALDELGDKQSYYLLEQFVPGDVYHADSIVNDGKVVFVSIQKYGAPPMQTYQGGGVFMTRTLQSSDEDYKAVQQMNAQVIKAMNFHNGVTHAEFIKWNEGGKFHFLEIAARVGGANIADMIEAGRGVNLWEEWGRLEVALLLGQKYELPKPKTLHAGLLMTLARDEHPNLDSFSAEEVVWKQNKAYHAGVIVASKKYERITELLGEYHRRLAEEFSAVGVPMGVTRTGQQG